MTPVATFICSVQTRWGSTPESVDPRRSDLSHHRDRRGADLGDHRDDPRRTRWLFGSWIDRLVTVGTDVTLAVPRVLIMIPIVAVFGSSIKLLIILIGVTGWALFARLVRAQVMSSSIGTSSPPR